jgi:hypothetical protein
MGKNMECVKRGLEALSLIGLQLPPVLDNPEIGASYQSSLFQEFMEATGEHGIVETFSRLPILQDKFLLAIHAVLVEITAPLAWAAPHLLHTIPFVGVSLTFKHGKCVESAFHVYLLPGMN